MKLVEEVKQEGEVRQVEEVEQVWDMAQLEHVEKVDDVEQLREVKPDWENMKNIFLENWLFQRVHFLFDIDHRRYEK